MLIHPAPQRGFTLVELLVTITIAAILMMLALPSMNAFFQNAKLGSAARSLQSGLQTARTEAIRRNMPVEFLMSNTPVNAGNVATAVPSSSGANWAVRVTDNSQSPPAISLIDSKAAAEGGGQSSGSTSIVFTPVAAASPGFTGSIQFNGLGATTPAGTSLTLNVSNPTAGDCAAANNTGGPMRCLTVKALPGGQVMVCDPLATVPDSRAC